MRSIRDYIKTLPQDQQERIEAKIQIMKAELELTGEVKGFEVRDVSYEELDYETQQKIDKAMVEVDKHYRIH